MTTFKPKNVTGKYKPVYNLDAINLNDHVSTDQEISGEIKSEFTFQGVEFWTISVEPGKFNAPFISFTSSEWEKI